jgi:tetratricopeptide (TPR) repeat protein
MGQFDQSITLYRHLLDGRPVDDRLRAKAVKDLSRAYIEIGSPDAAIEVLTSTRRVLHDLDGDGRVAIADMLEIDRLLARVLLSSGRAEEAQQILEAAMTRAEDAFGLAHPTTQGIADELTQVFLEQGRAQLALKLLERSMESAPQAVRSRADASHVRIAESVVDRLRDTYAHAIGDTYAQAKGRAPSDEEKRDLWTVGRLMYEVSLPLLDRIQPAWGISGDPDSAEAAALIERLADSYRRLPWPQYAPHALGAIRCEALAQSKRDTAEGFTEAQTFHEHARNRYVDFKAALGRADKKYRIALDETFLQLGLAEVGTACRHAERIIGRWSEGVDDASWDDRSQEIWIPELFGDLTHGAETGERVLKLVAEIDHDYGLVSVVDEDRMARVTAYRNPGIMTARAILLLISLCDDMATMIGVSPAPDGGWEEVQQGYLRRFERAYQQIGHETAGDVPFALAHTRSLVQLRLHYALIAANRSLPVVGPSEDVECLGMNPLDDAAIAAMSAWLSEGGHDANVIGSATMPRFVRSAERTARRHQIRPGYLDWRRQWPELDRYHREAGRRDHLERVFAQVADDLA